MKSQGMQENQQVLFMSDGGEDVQQVREYLHPNSERIIDWFHITMRLTVLQQQTKALPPDQQSAAILAFSCIATVRANLSNLLCSVLSRGRSESLVAALFLQAPIEWREVFCDPMLRRF